MAILLGASCNDEENQQEKDGEVSAELRQALFRSRRSPWSADAALGCCTEWKDKHEGQNMPLQMPHVSVCASHNELPQSKHCVLAVLEQRKPSASATFRTSMTSQLFGMEKVYCSSHKRRSMRETAILR
jgi:hypothetical protein